MSKLSIIIPAYNEEKNIPRVYAEVKKALFRSEYETEFIFVNDGSTDQTSSVILALAKNDPTIRLIEFSRNFGKEAATTAGLNLCQGDAAIILDADLQHPPALIPEFLKKWKEGAEVVVGVRGKNHGDGFIKKLGGRIFYRTINNISDTKIESNATDFRLLDRKVISAFNRLAEQNRMTRGLIDWLGFRREYIHFDAPKREGGKPRYKFSKLFNLAINSFVSFSIVPLKLSWYIGGSITLLSGMLGLFILIERYILGDPMNLAVSGTASLAILILFLVGVMLLGNGFVALYVAAIFKESQHRPLYVISKDTKSGK